MRRARDYDAELKPLTNKARTRKLKRVDQLVAATPASALDPDTLTGVLLDAVGSKDAGARKAWRAKGAALFQRRGRKHANAAPVDGSGAPAEPGSDAAGGSGAAANG